MLKIGNPVKRTITEILNFLIFILFFPFILRKNKFPEKIEKHLSEEEFLSDNRNYAATESYLRRALEAIFDICRHILSKMYGFKEIEYKKVALELGRKGIIENKNYVNTVLLKMAGYRNRLVHMYYEVSKKELYEIIQTGLSDIDRFVKKIISFLPNVRIYRINSFPNFK